MGGRFYMQKQAGFTILELLTVVAIVGILALVGIPSVKSFSQSTGLRASAKQIAGDLWLARQKAITTSAPYTIRFDQGQNRYVVFRDDGGGSIINRANGVMDSGESMVRTRDLSVPYAFSYIDLDPDNSIIYMPQGMLKKGTTGGSVTITDDRNRSRTVSVMASGTTRTM